MENHGNLLSLHPLSMPIPRPVFYGHGQIAWPFCKPLSLDPFVSPNISLCQGFELFEPYFMVESRCLQLDLFAYKTQCIQHSMQYQLILKCVWKKTQRKPIFNFATAKERLFSKLIQMPDAIGQTGQNVNMNLNTSSPEPGVHQTPIWIHHKNRSRGWVPIPPTHKLRGYTWPRGIDKPPNYFVKLWQNLI